MLKMVHIPAVALAGLFALSRAGAPPASRRKPSASTAPCRSAPAGSCGSRTSPAASPSPARTGRRGDPRRPARHARSARPHQARDHGDRVRRLDRGQQEGRRLDARRTTTSSRPSSTSRCRRTSTLDIDGLLERHQGQRGQAAASSCTPSRATSTSTGAAGSIDAETFSGDIEVKLASGRRRPRQLRQLQRLAAERRAGMIYALGEPPPRPGDIGSGSNDYHFKTFSGDVTIR